MPIEVGDESDNRAVSAFFRVFGGGEHRSAADARVNSPFRGMHLWEFRVLSVWIPFSVLVAVAGGLDYWVGTVAAVLLALPAGFLILNLLPLVLGGRSPAAQWRIWLTACTAWGLVMWNAGGLTGMVAMSWPVIFAINLLACCLGILKKSLQGSGHAAAVWRMALFWIIHLLVVVSGFQWGWLAGIGMGAAFAMVFCLAILRPQSQWLGPVTCRTGDRSILLTIDDGPDPHDTPVLLDLLDRHQVKAVFFLIGEKVLAHPELAREVVRRGHEIGNHTMTHPQASFWCAGPWRTRREIASCQQIIMETTGVVPRWFRAPVGHRNLFTHPYALAAGLRVMAWNRRGYDAVEKDPVRVLSKILPGLKAGDIVLIHEGTPIAREVAEGVLGGIREIR